MQPNPFRADHYWSGYYTSRPFHKNMDRVMEAHLRTAEVIYSLVLSHDLPFDQWLRSIATHLTEARRNLGLFQHHDGITGTAKDHVVIDYAKRWVRFLRPRKLAAVCWWWSQNLTSYYKHCFTVKEFWTLSMS